MTNYQKMEAVCQQLDGDYVGRVNPEFEFQVLSYQEECGEIRLCSNGGTLSTAALLAELRKAEVKFSLSIEAENAEAPISMWIATVTVPEPHPVKCFMCGGTGFYGESSFLGTDPGRASMGMFCPRCHGKGEVMVY